MTAPDELTLAGNPKVRPISGTGSLDRIRNAFAAEFERFDEELVAYEEEFDRRLEARCGSLEASETGEDLSDLLREPNRIRATYEDRIRAIFHPA